MVEDRHTVEQHQRRLFGEAYARRIFVEPDLDPRFPVGALAHPQFSHKFDEIFFQRMEARIVVEYIADAALFVEEAVAPHGQEIIQRVGLELPLDLHTDATGLQRIRQRIGNHQRGGRCHGGVDKGRDEFDMAVALGRKAFDLADAFLVSVNIGGVKKQGAVFPDGSGIDIRLVGRRGDEGVMADQLRDHGFAEARDPAADDLALVVGNRLAAERPLAHLPTSGDELVDAGVAIGGEPVVVPHGEAQRKGLRRRVCERQDAVGPGQAERSPVKPGMTLIFVMPGPDRASQFFIFLRIHDLNPLFHPLG